MKEKKFDVDDLLKIAIPPKKKSTVEQIAKDMRLPVERVKKILEEEGR